MTKKTIRIELVSGLEARPVAMLVQIASQYESSIYVENDGAIRRCGAELQLPEHRLYRSIPMIDTV